MAKKKNSRKALAVALAIMGVAGLSLASASQLNITATPANIAVGSTSFAAACDGDVSVAYTHDATFTNYTSLVVSGINVVTPNTCVGLTLKYTLKDNLGNPIMTGTATVGSTGTETISLVSATPTAGTPVPLTTGLGSLALVIY